MRTKADVEKLAETAIKAGYSRDYIEGVKDRIVTVKESGILFLQPDWVTPQEAVEEESCPHLVCGNVRYGLNS